MDCKSTLVYQLMLASSQNLGIAKPSNGNDSIGLGLEHMNMCEIKVLANI